MSASPILRAAGTASLLHDLTVPASVLLRFFIFVTIAAKALTVGLVLEDAVTRPWYWLATLTKTLPRDLLWLALLAFALALSTRVSLRPGWRLAGLGALCISYAAAVLLTFLNAGFFFYLGTSLSPELLLLIPSMWSFLIKSFTEHAVRLLLIAAVAVLFPLAALRHFSARVGPVPTARRVGTAIVLGLLGLGLEALPVRSPHEVGLRRMSALSVIAPRWRVHADAVPPTQQEMALANQLRDTPDATGAGILAGLPRRRYNVVVWGWESVGERYLASHHPLGAAQTPHLDDIAANGALRFTQAFAECPLSVQTAWSLFTGKSPPGSPIVFKTSGPLPSHPPMLPRILKAHGYHSSYFNGSFLRAWGEDRIAAAAVDLFEDAETLSNRAEFKTSAWSIDDRAIVARFESWLETVPAQEPVFSVVWPAETHHPYYWAGMAKDVHDAPATVRYRKAVERSDALLGKLWEVLARANRQDTILVVVGDHGQGLGRHGHADDLAHSRQVYEDAVHVPLIIVHPELPRGVQLSAVPCVHADLYPTLLDLLGIAAPAETDGRSLARAPEPRWIVSRSTTWWPAAIRAGRYKLLRRDLDTPPRLFDLHADPTESDDLSSREPAIAGALDRILTHHSAQRRRTDSSFAAWEDLLRPWWLPVSGRP